MAAAAPAESGGRTELARRAGVVGAAVLASRVLGLVREQAFAILFGAGRELDAFITAFRIPNLLRDLFAEGALSAAFQPAFAERLRLGGKAEAYRLASLVLTTLLVLVGLLTILGILFAPQLVATWAAGFSSVPGKTGLTVLLTRIMMPFLLLVSLAALAMGMLNAEERFLWPALAPALFNLSAIVGGGLLWALGERHSSAAAVAWAAFTLLGGALQLAAQLPALFRTGYRFALRLDLRFRDPGLRQILVTMVPATIGLMATQVNIYINSAFASQENGAVTWLNAAFRLLQLPIGMFGVAVGTVALVRYARSAAEGDAGEALQGVRETLVRAVRMVAFLTVPSSVGLWVLAEPIMALLYQHGAFHHADTLAAAAALRYYTVGLLAYAAVKVVAPVFYALKLVRVPVAATILAVLANVLFNVALFPRYGYRVLALGTSVAALVNLLVLAVAFQRRHGGLRRGDLWLALARVGTAAAVMGLVVAVADGALVPLVGGLGPPGGTLPSLCRVLVGVPLGVAAYAGLGALMGLEEIAAIRERLGKKLFHKRR
jgi:putative peptidoglycan lipid II flippase